ncbi:GntR family transcriptional regulator [Desulfovibrio sp.]|uniref:GntR family transcriptional regulator n=1 Tax=Desulfovibrio sp. TaxID=885 RepID=UPI0025C56FE8|nr:GntR family transcriptional regulator [Desulfovibrio sp.]
MSQVQTYSAQAIDYIKQCLLDGTLAPGDPIRETEIAEYLGISRGPVREALQTLLQQGLVTGLPQKAKHIRHLTAQEIEDSYCLGGTLEGACIVQSIDKWDDAALAEVKAILDEMAEQSRNATGLSSMSAVDEAFHNALLSRCSNRLMVRTARNSCAHISKFLYYKSWDTLFSPQEFYERHELIYEALCSRDLQRIERVLREHYAESGRRLGLQCGQC